MAIMTAASLSAVQVKKHIIRDPISRVDHDFMQVECAIQFGDGVDSYPDAGLALTTVMAQADINMTDLHSCLIVAPWVVEDGGVEYLVSWDGTNQLLVLRCQNTTSGLVQALATAGGPTGDDLPDFGAANYDLRVVLYGTGPKEEIS